MNPGSLEKIRILLVDDHALFREGVARLLGAEPDFELSAHCASTKDALRIVESTPIDIVLLDYDLGTEKGMEFLLASRERGFRGRILIVTAGVSDGEAADLLRHGAAGIFFKENSPALFAKSIRKVMAGEAWLEQHYVRVVLEAANRTKDRNGDARLTERERTVLRGVFEGLANKEIGARLSVSESSVKGTLQQLFSKTGVHTRSQLVRIALEKYRDQF